MKQVHITTGDPNGIGLEVTCKALKQLGPKANVQFILWRDKKHPSPYLKHLKSFKIKTLNNFHLLKNSTIKNNPFKKYHILDIACSLNPTQWVVQASKLCLADPMHQVLVTAPLSKTQIKKDGFSHKGHTPLLQKLAKKPVFMTFLGKYFNVVLLTGHIPLKKVKWTNKLLDDCIKRCLTLGASLSKNKKTSRNKKIAILGLNPHAGEEGLLGIEDLALSAYLKKWKSKVTGPLVPDTAFLKNNWSKYSLYVCLYHDQGLIPFKMIHARDSFQLSLGLPFMRTSVSHGTAQDIAGKNKADATSMKKALLWAVQKKPLF